MKAVKYTVTVTVEALSMDSVPGLIMEAAKLMAAAETPRGVIVKDDGDSLAWKTEAEDVEF